MQDAISWFEIPAADLARARKFYETIFAAAFPTLKIGETGREMALFPVDLAKGVGGAIVAGPGYRTARAIEGSPGIQEGAKVYLNGGEDLGAILARVEPAGGRIAVPKTQISPEFGFMGAFVDTEGNWVGLHSAK